MKAATGFEHGPPARYTHGALWIGNRDQQVTTVLDQGATFTSGEHGSDHLQYNGYSEEDDASHDGPPGASDRKCTVSSN